MSFIRSINVYDEGIVFRDSSGNTLCSIPCLHVLSGIHLTTEKHRMKDIIPGNYRNISVLIIDDANTVSMDDAFEDMSNLNVDMSVQALNKINFNSLVNISGMFRGVSDTSNSVFSCDISNISTVSGLYNVFLGSHFNTVQFINVDSNIINILNHWNLYPIKNIFFKLKNSDTLVQVNSIDPNIQPSYTNAIQTAHSFMRCLQYCKNNTISALDTAICVASKNLWHRFSQAKAVFLEECKNKNLLLQNTGINLTNDDTGSVIGLDAGGSTSYDAHDIVPESGDIIQDIPSSIVKVGLTLNVPTSLTDNQKNIIRALNTWWLESALNLIKTGYGLSFEDPGIRFNSMNLQFENNASSGALAYVSTTDIYGNVLADNQRRMVINEAFFSNYDGLNKDGAPADSSSKFFLDRVIAHELVHGVMGSCQPCFGSLPLFLKEGLSELIHGIDDMRINSINSLLNQLDMRDTMSNYLDINVQYASQLEDGDKRKDNQELFYIVGYIFLRWLIKRCTVG